MSGSRPLAALVLALLTALAGCTGSGGDSPDAGVLVDPVEEPAVTPCPEGWMEVERHGQPACDPTRGATPTACPAGQAWFNGASGCETVGTACPAGMFADDLPDTGVHYVAPGATGTGTRDAPFGTIAEAVAVVTPGQTIALARGTFEEVLRFPSNIEVRGACAAETVISPSSAGSVAVRVPETVTDARLRDVSVAHTDNLGVLVVGTLHAENLIVEDTYSSGIGVLGGHIVLDNALVANVRPRPGEPDGGGILVIENGTLEAEHCVIEQNSAYGIIVSASRGDLVDCAVRSAHFDAGRPAPLLIAEAGATVTAERMDLYDARDVAVSANSDATLTLRQSSIRHVRALALSNGIALATDRGHVVGQQLWIDDAHGYAVTIIGGSATLEDTVITDTEPSSLLSPGVGGALQVSRGAQVEIHRVRIAGMSGAAVLVGGDPSGARGDTRLTGSDVTISDVTDLGSSGIALYAASLVEVDLERVRVDHASELAIAVYDGSLLRLRHAAVSDTASDPVSGRFGRGLEVTTGAELELDHARFERQREIGLLLAGGPATLRDVQIVDTFANACSETSCPDQPGGIALGAYGGAMVDVSSFLIRGAPLCGVQVAADGQLDLHHGTIDAVPIGACVQVNGYRVARLTDDVAYLDVGVPVQGTGLYLPAPSDPLSLGQ